jgi:predicted MFS family arabinose efflux permease
MWLVVAVTYILAFFQRVAPQAFLDRLMADFSLDAAGIGALLSCYFYGYMAMQLPVGVIVDRWGVRLPVIASLVVSIATTLAFVHASSRTEIAIARLLAGAGDAVVFSSLMKLVAVRFASERFAFMAGASQVAGYFGGLLATVPLAIGVETFGWRGSLMIVVFVSSATLLAAILLLRDEDVTRTNVTRLPEMLRTTFMLLRRPSTWGPVVTWAAAYITSLSLLGVWGGSLLTQAYGFTRESASMLMFAFMMSYSVGALVAGHLADTWFRSVRGPIVAASALRVLLLLGIIPAVGAHLPVAVMSIEFALLGVVAGAMAPLVMSMLKLTFGSAGLATGIGLNAALGNLAAAVVQPALGAILEQYFAGTTAAGVRLYAPSGYGWVLATLAVLSCVSIIGALRFR